MPLIDGIEAARQICAGCPHTRVMMLSVDDSQEFVHRASRVGASGYVLKDTAGSDLVAAVRTLYKGAAILARKLSGFLNPPIHSKRGMIPCHSKLEQATLLS